MFHSALEYNSGHIVQAGPCTWVSCRGASSRHYPGLVSGALLSPKSAKWRHREEGGGCSVAIMVGCAKRGWPLTWPSMGLRAHLENRPRERRRVGQWGVCPTTAAGLYMAGGRRVGPASLGEVCALRSDKRQFRHSQRSEDFKPCVERTGVRRLGGSPLRRLGQKSVEG